ncbi:hypothetical protein [Gardnerella vaginalis]|nr:hypothetical protein [Gardnerella vaginalis]
MADCAGAKRNNMQFCLELAQHADLSYKVGKNLPILLLILQF